MEDLLKRNEVTDNQQDNGDVDYISAINEIKENSFDKAKYEKVVADNKRLLEAYTKGMSIDTPKENQKSIEELKEAIFMPEGEDELNINYIKNVLELRNRIIEEGGQDPFLPTSYDPADIEVANRVAAGFEHCLEYADGDPTVFTNELQRITMDSKTTRNKNR